MADISYTAVLNKNLKKSPLYMEQIEVVLDIKGAKVDPLTLQQIRDEDSINNCFKARRENINTLIEKASKLIDKAKSEKEAETVLSNFNKKLTSEVKNLEKELQTRVNAFIVKQKKDVNDLFWAQVKITCKIIWSVGKFAKGIAETIASVAVATTGVFLGVVALRNLVNSCNDLIGAGKDIVGALEGEQTQYKRLAAAIKELKAIKQPKTVEQSKIDAVSDLCGPYGAKLLSVDAGAKELASRLDSFLKLMDTGKFRNTDTEKLIEKFIDKEIKKIIQLSKNISKGRNLLQSARTKIRECSKRAKKDPGSYWDYISPVWKLFDGIVDIRSETLDVSEYKAFLSKCGTVVKGKLEDELKDAIVEEKTKV